MDPNAAGDETRRSDALLGVIATSVVTRAVVLLIGLLATISIDPPPGTPPELRSSPVLELPNRWDARWYVGIASGGYRYRGDGEVRWNRLAFFPAYPVTLRLVARLFRVPRTPAAWAWVGVTLSILAFAWATVFVYRLARQYSPDCAEFSAAILTAYPFAVFFGAAYTESFFLLGCTAAFWHFGRGSFPRSTVWGFFAGLVRPNGLLLAIPLFMAALAARHSTLHQPRRLVALAVVSPVLGCSLYSMYLWSLTGDPLIWITAQEGWGRTYVGSTGVVRDLVASVRTFGVGGLLMRRPFDSLNAIGGLIAVGAVVPVARRLGWPFAMFVIVNIIPPLLVGGLPSLGRYTAVLFPLHIWIALSIAPRFRAVALIGAALGQAFLATLHYTSRALY